MVEEVNQDIFTDDQNYKISVEKVYADFIKEIEAIRSHTNLTSIDVASDLDNSAIKLTINSKPQESRCHAFYRLIGLPVISKDGDIYSPGFFRTDNGNIDKEKNKKSVGKAIPDGLKILNFLREVSTPTFEQVFSTQSIDSSVLALSSINIRTFAAPLLKSDDPFDQSAPSYTVAGDDAVSNAVSFSELSNYVDTSGTQIPSSSTGLKLAKIRTHIIKPLMVFAPIELTVLPASKRIAVPFTKEKSERLIGNDMYVRKPYIETICRLRFDGRNKLDTLTPAQEETLDFIKEADSFKDLEIIKSISKGVGSPNDSSNFLKFFNVIRAIAKELLKATEDIGATRGDYLWIPIPNKKGPEFGSTTRDIVINDPNNLDKDRSAVSQIIKQRFYEITGDVLTSAKQDPNERLPQITPDNSSGLGNNNVDNLNQDLANRNASCEKANDALRKIEIIMGEFSGLGFSDIIAIYGALWLIEKKDLIGLMDLAAIERMKLVPELKADPDLNSPSQPKEAIKNFEKKVKELYELMDKAYDDARQNNNNTYTTQ